MEKRRVLVCLIVILAVWIQGSYGAYSSKCNASELVKNTNGTVELGLRGAIPDSFFTASSHNVDHKPGRGRLFQNASGNQASAWCAQFADKNQWLQIMLVDHSEITGIATQGQFDPINKTASNITTSSSWVTQYSIQYSQDNKTYYTLDYKYESPLVFIGNSNGHEAVCNNLPYPVKAKYIRIYPVSWKERICLRVGLFGTSVQANSTNPAFITPTDIPEYDIWWWWTFFWVLFAFMLLIILLGCLVYCCILRRRMQPMEKVLKEKPIKAPFQRKPDNGAYVNNAYDMAVISTQTTDSGTPETVEETGDEIQEVIAEFTADEQENERGIVGFSVADDTDENEEHDYENSDVNWEAYRERAKRRTDHPYENVDIKDNP